MVQFASWSTSVAPTYLAVPLHLLLLLFSLLHLSSSREISFPTHLICTIASNYSRYHRHSTNVQSVPTFFPTTFFNASHNSHPILSLTRLLFSFASFLFSTFLSPSPSFPLLPVTYFSLHTHRHFSCSPNFLQRPLPIHPLSILRPAILNPRSNKPLPRRMWSITFFSLAPMVLCVMIMNAAEPAIDYSYLHKPTATISSYPPSAVPAPRLQSPQGGGGGGLYVQNLDYSHKERSISAFSSSWLSSIMSSPVSLIRHLSRSRSSSSSSSPSLTAEIDFDEISTDFNIEELQQQEKRPPSRSRYSPPAAAYYVEDESIRRHHMYLQQQHGRQQQQQHHSTHLDSPSFNESGLCGPAAGTKVPTPHVGDDNNNKNRDHSPQTRNFDDPGKIPLADWHLLSALHNKPLLP